MTQKPTYEKLEQRVKELEKEINDRASSDKQLRLLSLAVEQSSEGVAVVDMDGNLEYLNHAFAEMHGYSAEELVGKNLSVFHTPEQMPSVEAASLEIKQKGSFKGEVWHVRRDGTVFPTLMHNSLIRDDTGKPTGMMGTLRDITDIKRTEEALKESEEKYRTQFEEALDAIFVADAESGIIVDCNHAASEMVGKAKAELIGKHQRIIHPTEEVEGEFSRTYEQHLREKEGQSLEAQVVTKNQEIRDVSIKANFFKLKDKKFLQGIFRDITDRKQAEKELRESQEKYRFLTENMLDMIWILGRDFRTTYVSPSIEKVLGFTPEERKQQSVEEAVTLESLREMQKRFVEELQRDKEDGVDLDRSVIIEVEYYHKDGSTVWMENRVQAIRDSKSTIVGMMGVSRDITERKRAEATIRKSEEKYRSLFQNAPIGIFIVDNEGNILDFNDAMLRLRGYSREDRLAIGRTSEHYYNPEDRERVIALVSKNGFVNEMEVKFKRKDGTPYDALLSLLPIEIDGKSLWHAMIQDITERKKSEEALRKSEEKFKALFEFAPDAYYLNDLKGYFIDGNKAAEKLIGYRKEELIGKSFLELNLLPPEQLPKAAELLQNNIEGQTTGPDELILNRKDGSQVAVEISTLMIQMKGQSVVLGIARDMTDRKRAEEELKKSEEKYKLLAENSADVIYKIDIATERYTYISPSIERLLGYTVEEGLSLSVKDSLTAESYIKQQAGLIETLSNKRTTPTILELEAVHKDGHTLPVEAHANLVFDEQGNPVEVLGVVRDITKRKEAEEEKLKLEAQLLHAKKMEAIGTLAGGIAHEFNNALMGIVGNIELLKMDLPEDERRDKYFDAMKSSSHRMSRLTDQLLAYAQGGKYQPKNLKLDDFVIETLPILQHYLNPTVRVETHLQKDISYVRADYAQMQTVLSAVLTNAGEAIEGEGLIKITARSEVLDKGFAEEHPGLKPGLYVCLTIEDDGKGMDKQTRNGIFDPFFTTKFQGRGMGMAAAYGIVKNHDGWIFVDSELDKGTAVRIYLPAVEVKVRKEEKSKIQPVKDTGTILIIEDEDVVIEATQMMLERLGYRVMVARTGKDAIYITETFDGDIDLALLDIKLPDMDGGKVYPLIMKARPNLKVIVFSGFAIDGPAREILDAGAQAFIQKPFQISTLAEKLEEVLGGS
jgi:two-component system cell cycle sensor histidine kinase/response regulator CckA